ncbi:MAG: D-glycero-beta-D-manno-heptose 1-phosphate adenylyltransferase [Candidatus Melainabacteria bacterium]|nr:D-glycero-beta-D-manno-heptose 1-phosphate adenylyltransferase [Candidatus Melainabacteria bacterium]
MAEIIPPNQLKHKIDFLRSKNKKLVVVATNGCFDILHVGHIRSLQKAKKLGDILVVGINSDSSVKKLKGNNRPINSQNERAEILAALECIDFVTTFDEESAEKFLELFKPEIYVKGGDYDLDNLPEAVLVRNYGGKTVQFPIVPGFSTTNTIEKLKKI